MHDKCAFFAMKKIIEDRLNLPQFNGHFKSVAKTTNIWGQSKNSLVLNSP